MAGKLNVSIQYNRRLHRSGKSRNKNNSNVTRQDCEDNNERVEHRASKATRKQVRSTKASFDSSCKTSEDVDANNDGEMLADGEVLCIFSVVECAHHVPSMKLWKNVC